MEGTETVDLSLLEWRGSDLIQSRFTKSAASLAGIAKTLSKNDALADEYRFFLDLYDQARAFAPLTFGRVWSDPSAYYWVRIAYDLVAQRICKQPLTPLAAAYATDVASLGGGDPVQRVLAEFGRFILALNFLEDQDCTLERPFSVRLPHALPGTPFSIRGEGVAEIGAISARDLTRCTEVSHETCTLRLQPAAFHLPGAAFAVPAFSATDEFQETHAPLVQKSLEVLARFAPDRFRQFRESMQLLALKVRGSGAYSSSSHPCWPGAMIAGVVDDPLVMAEIFIHELYQSRLFYLEESAPLFVERPAELFHEAFMHLPVAEYWFEVISRGGTMISDEQREYAIDRAMRIVWQLSSAIEQLEKFAHFSDHGAMVFRAIKSSAMILKERAFSRLPQISALFSE